MATETWFLLTYKVPAEPNRRRVALWRKLKSMGAVYLQSGVCLLPKTDDHRRALKVIENEIAEMEGEAVLLETVALDKAQGDKVLARFRADRDENTGNCWGAATISRPRSPRRRPQTTSAMPRSRRTTRI
nr:Chromate resistance protein ChrB [Rhizobium laguerreae]